jgi:hypothetical protein
VDSEDAARVLQQYRTDVQRAHITQVHQVLLVRRSTTSCCS